MQRRHFEAIARTISELDLDPDSFEEVVEKFIRLGRRENDRFKPDTFRAACERGRIPA